MSLDVVSRDLLEQFLIYISDNSTSGDTSLGLELEFYERNDFDPAIANRLYGRFDEWVNGFESPLAVLRPNVGYDVSARDFEYVRAIAIQLRNYFREKYGKPFLDNAEISRFSLGAPKLPHYKNRPNGEIHRVYRASYDEINAAVEHVRQFYSEIVPYIQALEHLTIKQGYEYRNVYGFGVPLTYINEGFYATIPSMNSYGSYTGWIEAREILSEEN